MELASSTNSRTEEYGTEIEEKLRKIEEHKTSVQDSATKIFELLTKGNEQWYHWLMKQIDKKAEAAEIRVKMEGAHSNFAEGETTAASNVNTSEKTDKTCKFAYHPPTITATTNTVTIANALGETEPSLCTVTDSSNIDVIHEVHSSILAITKVLCRGDKKLRRNWDVELKGLLQPMREKLAEFCPEDKVFLEKRAKKRAMKEEKKCADKKNTGDISTKVMNQKESSVMTSTSSN